MRHVQWTRTVRDDDLILLCYVLPVQLMYKYSMKSSLIDRWGFSPTSLQFIIFATIPN